MTKASEDAATKLLGELPKEQRVAFAILAYERYAPLYDQFVRVHEWGDSGTIGSALRALTTIAEGRSVATDELEGLVEQCEAAVPHSDDFGDALGSAAQSAALAICYALDYALKGTEDALSYVRESAIGAATAASYLPTSTVTEDEAEAQEIEAQLRDASAIFASWSSRRDPISKEL